MSLFSIALGVNIDHVATLRQARRGDSPDPLHAALLAEQSGADSITLHLREDRRHVQDRDVRAMRLALKTRMNLEMAATEEMVGIACDLRPADVCLVPEKREEVTTEGGLDVVSSLARVGEVCAELAAAGIRVSLFIDPDESQVDAALRCGAPAIELHTGAYAGARGAARAEALHRLAGDTNSWKKTNSLFISSLRKQFLIWRTVPVSEKATYAETGQDIIEGVADGSGAPAPQPA